MTDKILYKGIFNWYGEVTTLYRHSYNKNIAFTYFIRLLAIKYNKNIPIIRIYFRGTNKFEIKEEKYEKRKT